MASTNQAIQTFKRNNNSHVASTTDQLQVVMKFSPAATAWLVQSISVSFQNQIQEVREVGSNKVRFVSGRPQGQCQMTRAAWFNGSSDNQTNVNNVRNQTVNMKTGKCASEDASITVFYGKDSCGNDLGKSVLKGVVPEAIGWTATADSLLFMEQLSFRFSTME